MSSLQLQEDEDLVDITHFVEECAASLTLTNPFLSNGSFSLHDSMAATQLGDHKMDCCEIPISLVARSEANDDRTVYPRPAPTGLNDDFTPLKWDDLSLADAALIGLHILVRIESLLNGASVVETTFTNMYAQAPVMIDMRERLFPGDDENGITDSLKRLSLSDSNRSAQFLVYASSLALLDVTQQIRTIIHNADIYEEEDFVSCTYDVVFFTDQCKDDVTEILRAALQTVASSDESDSIYGKIARQVILFQFEFRSTLSSLTKLREGLIHGKAAEAKVRIHQTAIALKDLLVLMKDLSVPDSVKETLRTCFDPYVNRPLVGNAPVRTILLKDPMEAVSHIQTIVGELDWAVCDFVLSGDSLGRIRRSLDRLTQASANILTRSFVILNLYFREHVFGLFELSDLIVRDMRQWARVPDAMVGSDISRAFVQRLAKPIYDTLKLRTLTKNRQRGYIEIALFPEWVSLQDEAQVTDLTYRQEHNLDKSSPPYFSQYILTIMLRLMEKYVASGVELGLFRGHEEISYALWYRDFLLSGLLSNLTSTKREKSLAQRSANANNKGNSKNQRGKKKNNRKSNGGGNAEPKPSAEDKEDEVELSVIALKRNICRGTIRFLAALRQAGALQDPNWEFTAMERIFGIRFQAFEIIQQPPILTYEYYLEGSDFSSVTLQELQSTTGEWFQSCKKSIDQLLKAESFLAAPYSPIREAELRSLLKICVGNSVYVLKLGQALKQDPSKIDVSFDHAVHGEFYIVKLV